MPITERLVTREGARKALGKIRTKNRASHEEHKKLVLKLAEVELVEVVVDNFRDFGAEPSRIWFGNRCPRKASRSMPGKFLMRTPRETTRAIDKVATKIVEAQ